MDLGPEARRLLELTRATRTPSERDRARVERLVAAAIPAAAAASAPRSAFAAAKAKVLAVPLTMKVAAAAAVVAAIVAVGVVRRSAPRAVQVADVVAPAAPGTVVPAAEPPAVPAPTARTATTAEAPRAAPPSLQRKSARPRAATSDTLAQELDLLHEAQAKWRGGDADGALSLLALHRERYPRSEVAPERDALRVLSLCATGRAADARTVAQHFLQRYPRSPLRASVEESCALP